MNGIMPKVDWKKVTEDENYTAQFIYLPPTVKEPNPLMQSVDIGFRFSEKTFYLQGKKRTFWGMIYGWDKVDFMENLFKSVVKKMAKRRH